MSGPTVIDRECAVCGDELRIRVAEDGEYDVGHFFGMLGEDEIEYWECDECYRNE